MININTIDDRKFSLNGIPYLRNYISAVYSTNVEVFNCYERHDVLVEQTHFNQFRVNGTIYNTAAALQTALLDVIYSRNTMGGSIPDQDNIDIRKYFLYNENYTSSQILSEINGLANYTVNEKQSVWFIGRNFQLLQPAPGGVLIPPSRDSAVPVLSSSSVVKYKMLNKGKGVYGSNGIQLTWDDLELVYQDIPTVNDIIQYPETDILNFEELGTQQINQWLNSRIPAITIQPQNEGYTLFKGTADGESKSYLWVGEAGTYGASNPTAAINDFEILEDVPPAPYVPGQNEVTANGNVIINNEHRFVKVEEGTEVQTHAIDENGQYFKKGNFVITEKYADPTANVEYTKPAKPVNDVYVMQSDLKQQQLKVIDTHVAGSLYTITNEDFGKTLVYNGLDDINMFLSTNLTYEPGYFVNVIQANMGNIAFVVDGFILKYSPDELPETYAYNSTATIIILEEYLALVFGKLKLAD
jgi:hypothetical protein